MPNLTGQSIGRYHILEQLGEGGMATVYKAYDTRLERNVALKVLRTDQFIPAQLHMVLQRFEREAKSLAKLKHPNIVNILDFGEHLGMPYLIMEYLPGGTLKQKLGQKILWQDAIRTLIPVARGLAYAHQHGIIHRDVKPANVLIDENKEPILTDFGIAKLLEGTEGHTLTGSGVGIGTPEYMAPEQGIGASTIDARADIYSLGIVLYEMVTGRKPYTADTPMAVVLKQMTDPLPRPTDFVPDLPEKVEQILLKALAKEPDDRYADMNLLIDSMEGVLKETQKAEKPAPAVPTPMKYVKKQDPLRPKTSPKLVVAIVGVLAVVLVVSFGVPWMAGRFSAAPEPKSTSTKTIKLIPTKLSVTSQPIKTLELTPTSIQTQTLIPIQTESPSSDSLARWVPINFSVTDASLWKDISEESYLAIGSKDAFAWSADNYDGDLIVSFDLESSENQASGCMIIYGNGQGLSYGNLIFCVDWDGYGLEKHTIYHQGENRLAWYPSDVDLNARGYSVTIEIIDNVANMYVNGDKILSTGFDKDEIDRSGRIGLFKKWFDPEVRFKNIRVKYLTGT